MSNIVIVLVILSKKQVGVVFTEIPINVAHPVVRVGVIVAGKTILIIPEDESTSLRVTFIL